MASSVFPLPHIGKVTDALITISEASATLAWDNNRSNGCKDIAILDFQDGRHPPTWIYKKSFKWSIMDNVHHHTKFHQNWSNS